MPTWLDGQIRPSEVPAPNQYQLHRMYDDEGKGLHGAGVVAKEPRWNTSCMNDGEDWPSTAGSGTLSRAHNPGPGQYTIPPADAASKCAVKMAEPGREPALVEGPAPNHYPLRRLYHDSDEDLPGAAVFVKDARWPAECMTEGEEWPSAAGVASVGRAQYPGPGAYDHAVNQVPCATKMMKQDSEARFPEADRAHSNLPGPGAYLWKETKARLGPETFTDSGRYPDLKVTPGPGDYSPKLPPPQPTPATLAPKQNRFDSPKPGPGPAEYLIPQPRSARAHSFGWGERGLLNEIQRQQAQQKDRYEDG
eukprot:CAMPEP_0114312594 /NCGR_PEP_ID=MMETSP0059-20121206/20545_1 /TAXON_ID=36894 /ORGANISM="Pyramimonas parkeae, Strain CCMP726" /LENGTH=306 /DNA_ID=CAMNT_0001437053 /DNA_START=218 /DNA_END=1137 /DNA_ORIENTATION=-